MCYSILTTKVQLLWLCSELEDQQVAPLYSQGIVVFLVSNGHIDSKL